MALTREELRALLADAIERAVDTQLYGDELDAADAVLSALRDAGVALAPREPTQEMWGHAENESMVAEMAYESATADDLIHKDAHSFPTARIWHGVVMYRAMLAASPYEEE